MFQIRTFRRPRTQPAPEQIAPKFKLCSGCVTPKFCRENDGCDADILSRQISVKKQRVSKKSKASK